MSGAEKDRIFRSRLPLREIHEILTIFFFFSFLTYSRDGDKCHKTGRNPSIRSLKTVLQILRDITQPNRRFPNQIGSKGLGSRSRNAKVLMKCPVSLLALLSAIAAEATAAAL